jgi:hypothetical protein
MTEGFDRRVASAPSRLPPLELLPFVAKEKFPTPVDEHGVPDMRALLVRLGETITYDPEYEASIDLRYTNLHHAAYKRRDYWQHGKGSFQVKHRENPDVKALMFIPFHNLDHLLGLQPKMTKNEVMRQRANETDNLLRLYRLGSAALWLDEMALQGAQTYRTAEEYLLRELLGSLDLADVVALLGERATKQAAFTAAESTAIIMEASRRASGYDLAA